MFDIHGIPSVNATFYTWRVVCKDFRACNAPLTKAFLSKDDAVQAWDDAVRSYGKAKARKAGRKK